MLKERKQSVKKNRDKLKERDIEIKGARTHNLKNVDVVFPRNKLIVVTGVSGRGKSSLTIDTLFAEGQRRYAESLSAYARQFMARMDKPDVDYIKGLCPAIAIEQKVITRTPRSTVGSMTEIYDYLRLLYARVGKTISPVSGKEVKKDDVTDVVRSNKRFTTRQQKFLFLLRLNTCQPKCAGRVEYSCSKRVFAVCTIKQTRSHEYDIEDLLELPDEDLLNQLQLSSAIPNNLLIYWLTVLLPKILMKMIFTAFPIRYIQLFMKAKARCFWKLMDSYDALQQ